MIIKTVKAKNAHDFASRIPMNLWNSVFHEHFDCSKIPSVETSLKQVERANLPDNDAQAFIVLIIRYPLESADELLSAAKRMLELSNIKQLTISAAFGKLDFCKLINKETPHELPALIEARNYDVCHLAAENGHLDTLKWLKEQAPDALLDMIEADDYHAFRWAARNGHLDILKWLKEQAPLAILDMISTKNYAAFRLAARNGYLDTLKWLKKQAPDALLDMIRSDKYGAFRRAAENGHLDTLKWLKKQELVALLDMIRADKHWAFRRAAEKGHLDKKWLKTQEPDALLDIIRADMYGAFCGASEHGHLDTLKWLKKQEPDALLDMIRADDYKAFRGAAENGHLDTLKWLKEQAPDALLDMIEAGLYYAFIWAAHDGYLDILKWLKEQARDALLDMIKVRDHAAFRWAAENGHLDTLKWLKEQAPDALLEMIETYDYEPFRMAVRNDDLNTCNWLLQHPQCLAYAEQHVEEYGERIVNPFIQDTLASLHEEQGLALQVNPNAVFDISLERAPLYFYLLRNLIRRNDPALNDELLFLLDIPAVKNLVHTAVTPNQPNELVRLAITTGNEHAAARLLTIPAVRQLAEQNEFYRNEAQGQLDLRAVAQDRESSMHALTTGEQQRIAEAINRYQPLIKATGVEHVIEALRDQLIERYKANPASITVNEVVIPLPTTWKEFQELKLTPEAFDAALIAYRTNKNHTALRYLSKPNHWMAKNASYVYVNENNTNERWSTFEGYLPETALFWLAAQDTQTPPTDGHTLEGRADHFVDELALIGRAHNWDKLKRNDKGILVEYDDADGDKPSCFSGVKRRLFQSVIGHPLLKFLTIHDLNQELRQFAREHFASFITKDNKKLIQDTLEEYNYVLEIEDNEGTKLIKSMDIPLDKQKQFIDTLREKYGAQFNAEPRFKTFIENELKLEERNDTPSTYAHVFKLGTLAGITNLLEEPHVMQAKASKGGFFAHSENQMKEHKKNDNHSEPVLEVN